MRNVNPGSIVFFIFMFIILSNLFNGIGFFFPFIIFFFIANGMSKKRQEQKRGHVRESTRRRRTVARERQRVPDYRRGRTTSRPRPRVVPKNNPFKKSGKDKFKDYDYDGAIDDFTKALQIDGKDPAVYFNLACAYSLTEQKDKAFEALSKSFALGFKDVEKVKTHDALAFLRVQEEFDQFVAGKYQWPLAGSSAPGSDQIQNSELLQQLKQLADLREKGLLTDEEFLMQKKRLLK